MKIGYDWVIFFNSKDLGGYSTSAFYPSFEECYKGLKEQVGSGYWIIRRTLLDDFTGEPIPDKNSCILAQSKECPQATMQYWRDKSDLL